VKIWIASRRRSAKPLRREHGEAALIDVTSRAPDPWVRLSPFYPHGGLPVPLSPGVRAQSVEGVWQGLKVFESAGVDTSKFEISSMKGLKRTVRRLGPVLGHAAGVGSNELLTYGEARHLIYLPTYRYVLEQCVTDLVERLRELARGTGVVLLDYETNCDIDDLSKPLSHAGLIRAHIMGHWPVRGSSEGGRVR